MWKKYLWLKFFSYYSAYSYFSLFPPHPSPPPLPVPPDLASFLAILYAVPLFPVAKPLLTPSPLHTTWLKQEATEMSKHRWVWSLNLYVCWQPNNQWEVMLDVLASCTRQDFTSIWINSWRCVTTLKHPHSYMSQSHPFTSQHFNVRHSGSSQQCVSTSGSIWLRTIWSKVNVLSVLTSLSISHDTMESDSTWKATSVYVWVCVSVL